MFKYITKRVMHIFLSLLIVITVVYFLFRLIPGDPTVALLGDSFTLEAKQMVIERFGLNKPLRIQYWNYMKNVFKGDFGNSFYYRLPANKVIGNKIVNTLALLLPSVLLSYFFGTLIGAISSYKLWSRFENIIIAITLFFRSTPIFWLAMLGTMLFSYKLGWLPNSGMRTPGYIESSFYLLKFFNKDFVWHLTLPLLVLVSTRIAVPLLLMRTTMIETFEEGYIKFCQTKGLSEGQVLFKHSFRNALLPVVTSFSLAIGTSIGGQIIIEYIFGWPGLGREIVLATQRSDYPVAQFGLIVLAGSVMIMNLTADILYAFLDPRIRIK